MDYQLFGQIQNLIDRDKLDLAHKKIGEALANYPDSDELYSLQALVYINQKNYKQAQTAIHTGIGLNPENDYLFYLNARLAIENDEYKAAEENINQAISINPYQAGYFGTKAANYINQKKYDQAIEAALEGLDLNPDDTSCNNMLSMAQTQTGLGDEAFNRLESLLADDPENELTQANTGYYYLRQGNSAKAKEHFAAALNSNPEFEFARAGMIQAIKSTNWFYAKLMQFSYWLDEMNARYRWGFIIGLVLIVKLIPILALPYLIFIFWTWFTGPISDVLLYFDKYGRYLMSSQSLKYTQINIGVLALGTLALAAGIFLHGSFLMLAFSLLLTTIPVALASNIVKKNKQAILAGFAVLFVGTGLFAVYLGYFMLQTIEVAATALIIFAVIFSWTVAFIRK